MSSEARIRVLLAKPTHDCHDRGVRYLAKKFRDAGFEVIFSNFLLPADIVQTAVQEDVDIIGVSSSSGGHLPVFETLAHEMKERGMGDRLLIGGGVIPKEDQEHLKQLGVAAIFGPGSSAEQAIDLIREWAERQ